MYRKYLAEGSYHDILNQDSSYSGEVTRELGKAFIAIKSGSKGSVALTALRKAIGDRCKDFAGYEQQDSHEFLMSLLNWVHEDLVRNAVQIVGKMNRVARDMQFQGISIISQLFEGEQKQRIMCSNCHHESITLEPFRILSIPLLKGRASLTNMLNSYYKDCSIDYRCPACKKSGSSTRSIGI